MTVLFESLMECPICGRRFWATQPDPLPFTPTLPERSIRRSSRAGCDLARMVSVYRKAKAPREGR